MSMIIGFLCRYILATAVILAYIDEGPGGDKVGAAVYVVKGAVLSIDWHQIASGLKATWKNSINTQGGARDEKKE